MTVLTVTLLLIQCMHSAERHRSNLYCLGDRGQPGVSSRSQFEQQKTLVVASERGYTCSNFILYVFTNTINGKAKPKEHCQKTLNIERLHKRKDLFKNLGGKEDIASHVSHIVLGY